MNSLPVYDIMHRWGRVIHALISCPPSKTCQLSCLIPSGNETGVDLEHHWKNRINYIILCIIVPINSKYGSEKKELHQGNSAVATIFASLYSCIALSLKKGILPARYIRAEYSRGHG